MIAALLMAGGFFAVQTGWPLGVPPPKHTCKSFSPLKGNDIVDTDSVGRLYAAALKAQGLTKGSIVVSQTMLQAYADMLGCFLVPPASQSSAPPYGAETYGSSPHPPR